MKPKKKKLPKAKMQFGIMTDAQVAQCRKRAKKDEMVALLLEDRDWWVMRCAEIKMLKLYDELMRDQGATYGDEYDKLCGDLVFV
jgi:hypothetical protein